MELSRVQGHRTQGLPGAGVCNAAGSGRRENQADTQVPLMYLLCSHRCLGPELDPEAAGE